MRFSHRFSLFQIGITLPFLLNTEFAYLTIPLLLICPDYVSGLTFGFLLSQYYNFD